MYQLLLEIEDHEKKALALPEQDRFVWLYMHCCILACVHWLYDMSQCTLFKLQQYAVYTVNEKA